MPPLWRALGELVMGPRVMICGGECNGDLGLCRGWGKREPQGLQSLGFF
jgi:hypothetical protein